MLTILCLVETTPRDMVCYDKSFKPFAYLKASMELGLFFTVVVEDSDTDLVYSVNLSAMMAVYPEFNTINDYAALEAFFTVSMIELYEVKAIMPANMFTRNADNRILMVQPPIGTDETTGPKIISITHNLDLISDYGTRLNPSLRNNANLKWHLPDIILRHKDPARKVVDFEQCLPVINGKIHYPLPFNDELYVLNSTGVLRSSSEGGMANLLMDFAPMGGMQTVRFKDCTKIPTDRGVTVKLPDGMSLTGKSFILVLAGRFFQPQECSQLNEDTIYFDTNNFNLENVLLSNKHLNKEFNKGTMVATTDSTEYTDQIFDEDHYESFIVVFNTDAMQYLLSKPLFNITPRMLKFPVNTGGLLIRIMTREIVDYSRQYDTDGTIVYISPPNQVNRIPVDRGDNIHNSSYVLDKGGIYDHVVNSEDDGYVMFDIITREPKL